MMTMHEQHSRTYVLLRLCALAILSGKFMLQTFLGGQWPLLG